MPDLKVHSFSTVLHNRSIPAPTMAMDLVSEKPRNPFTSFDSADSKGSFSPSSPRRGDMKLIPNTTVKQRTAREFPNYDQVMDQ